MGDTAWMGPFMTRIGMMIAALWVGLAGMAAAQNRPVVVELFTSQGCSSCPPADALLHELAKDPDVIALSLHVDYWDYIGWKDSFGDPAYTERQRSYARAQRERMVYTPQVMLNGVEHVVGNRSDKVRAALGNHRKAPEILKASATRQGSEILIDLDPATKTGNYIVHLVSFRPNSAVKIKRGENAGREISYANVVTSWRSLEKWDGRNAKSISASVSGSDKFVVIVQHEQYGEIIGSARVN